MSARSGACVGCGHGGRTQRPIVQFQPTIDDVIHELALTTVLSMMAHLDRRTPATRSPVWEPISWGSEVGVWARGWDCGLGVGGWVGGRGEAGVGVGLGKGRGWAGFGFGKGQGGNGQARRLGSEELGWGLDGRGWAVMRGAPRLRAKPYRLRSPRWGQWRRMGRSGNPFRSWPWGPMTSPSHASPQCQQLQEQHTGPPPPFPLFAPAPRPPPPVQ